MKFKLMLALFVIIFSMGLVSSASTLNDGLLSYFAFEETSGNAIDSLGGVSGTDNSVNQNVPGKILSGSEYTSGSVSNFDFGTTSDMQGLGAYDFTVNLWLNSTTTAAVSIWGNDNLNLGTGVDITGSGTTPRITIDGASYTSSAYAMPQDTWFMMTIRKEGTNLTFYKDNVVTNELVAVTTGNSSVNFRLGSEFSGSSKGWDGRMDEIGFWNRSLTLDEITTLYNTGDGASYPFSELKVTTTLDSPADSFMTAANSVELNVSSATTNDLVNVTIFVWDSAGDVYNQTNDTITGIINQTSYTATGLVEGSYEWNALTCAENSTAYLCNFAELNNSFSVVVYTVNNYNVSFISPIYETETTNYNVSFNITIGPGADPDIIPTANLYVNGTKYVGTGTDLGDDEWSFIRDVTVPIGVTVNNIFWEIFVDATTVNTTSTTQTASLTNISYCSPVSGTPFINFTYFNETVSQEATKAFVSSSTWDFWLGNQEVTKSISFSDATEYSNHTFCATPADRTFNVNLSYSYDNSESQQRTYNPSTLSLTNTTTEQALWMLPTSDGIFVTFQVLTVADQPISGATVTIEREGFGVIATQTTGGSGSVNIWLNPNFVYTLTVEVDGFADFTTTQAFPTTEFTIVMGSNLVNSEDYVKGITLATFPKVGVLLNNTNYTFNYTISSSYWLLDSFGFNIRNQSGTILGTNSSSVSTGGFLDTVINTGNNSLIIFEYYWEVNNSYNNISLNYAVRDAVPGSIGGFFERLKTYTQEGIFGLNFFGLSIILFTVVFLVGGILSFKFGLTSPLVIFAAIGAIVIFFDIFGILPNPTGVPFLPTIITLLLLFIAWRSK